MLNGSVKKGQVGSVGRMFLAFFLILFGITMLLSIVTIPNWIAGLLMLLSGVLLLIGR